jgi:hypothetical protein
VLQVQPRASVSTGLVCSIAACRGRLLRALIGNLKAAPTGRCRRRRCGQKAGPWAAKPAERHGGRHL